MTNARASVLTRLAPRHLVLIAALASLVAFLPSLADGFVFDDDALIVHNPFAHDFAQAGRCFTTDLWDTPERPDAQASTKFYRPLVCLSYIVNWKLGGHAPWSFHLVNIVLHAVACALAARLALRWTGSPAAALLATLAFAIHPSRTENVIWVSGRTDVLMAALLLGAHELTVDAAKRSSPGRFLLGAFLFVLAVLSKEVAIVWPLFLAIEALLARSNTDIDSRSVKRALLRACAVSLAAATCYVVARSVTLPLRPREIDSMALPPLLRAGYVALSLGYYVERIVFPWPQTFHFRPVQVVDGVPVLFTPSVVLGAVVAALYLFWAVRAFRRDRLLLAILGVVTILFLPILNVSYTGFRGATSDRFLYLPLLPLAVAAARHAGPALERWVARPLAPIVCGAAALLSSAVCWARCLDYLSDETLWRHELEVNPDNPQALAGLSEVLASQGDIDDASFVLRRALTPAALRYRLLANPTRYYLGLLEMQGPRLADGNVSALEALLGEIASLEGLRPPRDPRLPRASAGDLLLDPPVWDENFAVHLANASEHLSAAGALLASRLGHDHGDKDLLRPLLSRVGEGHSLGSAAHYNLAIVLGRAGDYASARGELARAVAITDIDVVRTASRDLDASLHKVEDLRLDASRLPEPEARTKRAAAFLELGAYLRAARQLRPVYLASPTDVTVTLAYVDALVHARLDADADAVASQAPDPARVRARIDDQRRSLSPRTAHALGPPSGERWWETPPVAP